MKKIITLFALMCLSHIVVLGQKKYEMVVEKTDGTEIVIKTEEIIRTYFREIAGESTDKTPAFVKAVDMGLPSGTKWSNVNVGASSEETFGDYFAWGETKNKSNYTLYTYDYYINNNYISLGESISGTEYDVAYMSWGGSWHMPTLKDFQELMRECSSQWITINGRSGLKVTAKNGNSIFLPATGVIIRTSIESVGYSGHYWTADQHPNEDDSAYGYYISQYDRGGATWTRYWGACVRPVMGGTHPEEEPKTSNIDESLLTGKWICSYQQKTEDGYTWDASYSTSEYYIVFNSDKTGLICSGRDQLFEQGTWGKERPFAWEVSGQNIIANFYPSVSVWEVVTISDNELVLRWVGGVNGNYVIIGKFHK